MGWPVGKVIASEAELLAKYEVSRAVLREAIRIVEHHGVAWMRRGPGGGLVVARPNITAVSRSAALFLRYHNVTLKQLLQARTALELPCVELACSEMTEARILTVREAVKAEQELLADPASIAPQYDFHALIASLANNSPLQLFVGILMELQTVYSPAQVPSPSPSPVRPADLESGHRAHAAIADAIIAGDAALARHRMSRHLDAITARLAGALGPHSSEAEEAAAC
jgi:DNA-binding FadR family transcriptional regulator